MAVVLCTGTDPVLLETRKLILEEAGHIVVTAANEIMVRSACRQSIFDVAVIGQSAQTNSKKSIAVIIREECPSVKILELYTPYEEKSLEDADSWLEVPTDKPQELAVEVSRLAKPKRQMRISA